MAPARNPGVPGNSHCLECVCVCVRARLASSLSPSLSLMCVCLCVFARGSVCLRSSCLGRREEEHQEQRTQSQLFFFLFLFFFFSSAKEAASVGPAGQEAGTGSGWMGPALIGPVTEVKVDKRAHSHFLVVAVFFCRG